MQQAINIWTGLDNRRKTILILASVALVTTIWVMIRMAAAPSMVLLYAGLENGAAGDVVTALEQRGTPFEVRGGSIYVPASSRDELRLTLASEGLPMTGGRGYELLDNLSGFGTTSQMFDAAYWRAKEGELARTIVASPFVSQARVHIANAGSNPFQRSVAPTASVSVVPTGVPVTPAQANALRYLVASAVSGMTVDNVAVIDANGAVIGQKETVNSPSNGEDRAQILRERVLRLVEARVGRGNAVVEVSVDTVTETESIRMRQFDPESRVAISTETEERSDSSQNQASGSVTVASNLPDGDAAEGEGSSAQASETRERVNYEVSETEHEILKAPGSVRRLTVAVLVNGLSTADTDGEAVFQERPESELTALRDLVASAVGYQEDRGDVITLKSMELPSVEASGSAATPGFLQQLNLDVMSLIKLATLAFVAMILVLFVLRPLLSTPPQQADTNTIALPDLSPDGDLTISTPDALTGEIQTDDFTPLPQLGTGDGDVGGLPDFSMGTENPADRLRNMIGERQEETVELLRSWLEEKGEKAG